MKLEQCEHEMVKNVVCYLGVQNSAKHVDFHCGKILKADSNTNFF